MMSRTVFGRRREKSSRERHDAEETLLRGRDVDVVDGLETLSALVGGDTVIASVDAHVGRRRRVVRVMRPPRLVLGVREERHDLLPRRVVEGARAALRVPPRAPLE